MERMLVTLLVSIDGTVVRELQLRNKEDMMVTLLVESEGNVTIDSQESNVLYISLAELMFMEFIDVSETQPLNR